MEERELMYSPLHIGFSLTKDKKINMAESSAIVLDAVVNKKENKEGLGGEMGNHYTYYEFETMIEIKKRRVVFIGKKEPMLNKYDEEK